MGRPAKVLSAGSHAMTNADKAIRQEVEDTMRGDGDALVCPDYLTPDQRAIFEYLLDNLKDKRVLGNLDLYALTQLAIVTDRITQLEKDGNDNPELIYDKGFMAARRQYSNDFLKFCTEFCLSPQSRAKLSVTQVKQTKQQSLMDMLSEG